MFICHCKNLTEFILLLKPFTWIFFYQRGRSKKVNKVVSEILLLRAACRSETNLLKLYFRTVISGFGSSNKSAFTVMLDSNYC